MGVQAKIRDLKAVLEHSLGLKSPNFSAVTFSLKYSASVYWFRFRK